jgi:hypothetical protein
MLTLLMVPGGHVHRTSGILPRKSLELARDCGPGPRRDGAVRADQPVLVDPAQMRLPKVSAFPKKQIFTQQATPSIWKDDPILATTQTTLLPDLPHEVQKSYIRVTPDQKKET